MAPMIARSPRKPLSSRPVFAFFATLAGLATLAGCTVINPPATPIQPGAMIADGSGTIRGAVSEQEAEFHALMAGTGARVTNTGSQIRVILPESISFPYGSTDTMAGLSTVLKRAARGLKAHPDSMIRVVGHSDGTGSDAYQSELTRERARIVAQQLVSAGVNSTRLSFSGHGGAEPITSNATEAGRANNRRVELVITPTN